MVTIGVRKVNNVYVIWLVNCTTNRRTSGKYESSGHYTAPPLEREAVKTNTSIYVRTYRCRSPQTIVSREPIVAGCDQVLR